MFDRPKACLPMQVKIFNAGRAEYAEVSCIYAEFEKKVAYFMLEPSF